MVTPPITYVRHSMAAMTEDVHPTDWHLDDAGRADARRLAARLEIGDAGIGALVTSTEPKALETAQAIGEHWSVEVVPDERLREAVRPWIGPGYRAVVHRYLRGELPDGWEPHGQVAARAGAAVADARRQAGTAGGPAIVVSHGLALSLHLRETLGWPFDRESFWSCLSFPDAWALDEAGTLHRPLEQVRTY
jgi:broad specificity phosphatase PhoE